MSLVPRGSEGSMKRMAISLISALTLVWFASFRVAAEKQLFSLTIEAPSEPLKS